MQVGTLVPFDQVESTDAEGRFTLFAVAAGDYLVRAEPPAGVPLGATWFGGASEPELATVIPVTTGADVTQIDIALPEPSVRQASVVALLSLAWLSRAARRRSWSSRRSTG